jgi:hypothetical protein
LLSLCFYSPYGKNGFALALLRGDKEGMKGMAMDVDVGIAFYELMPPALCASCVSSQSIRNRKECA